MFFTSITPPDTVRSSPTVKSAFVVKPVSATCVTVISESAPKFSLALSELNEMSSPKI